MGRQPSRELVGKIADALTSEPRSIQEIADTVGADRQSVSEYLQELEGAGLVQEQRNGRSREFYVSEYEENDTYFQLPLTESQKDAFKYIYTRILDTYREEFDSLPDKLMAQKIAVKVIDRLGLDLPYGRYQFGAITAMNYTVGRRFDIEEAPNPETDTVIEQVTEEYGPLDFNEARRKQYEDEGMTLYLVKEKIMARLASDIEDKEAFKRLLRQFIANTPSLSDDSEAVLLDFVAIAPDLLDDPFSRSMVSEAFKELWDLIALHCFKEDLKAFYDDEVLEKRLRSPFDTYLDEATQAVAKLVNQHESDTDIADAFQEHIGTAERREQAADEDKDTSEMAREFGLDA